MSGETLALEYKTGQTLQLEQCTGQTRAEHWLNPQSRVVTPPPQQIQLQVEEEEPLPVCRMGGAQTRPAKILNSVVLYKSSVC